MKRKFYTLVLTFLCLLCSQVSFAQTIDEGGVNDGFTDLDNLIKDLQDLLGDDTVAGYDKHNIHSFVENHKDDFNFVIESVYDENDYNLWLQKASPLEKLLVEIYPSYMDRDGNQHYIYHIPLHDTVKYNPICDDSDDSDEYDEYVENGDCTDYRSYAYPCNYVDNGDCTDYRSYAYPCNYFDNGDCTDYRSYAYPCETYDPCDPGSMSYDPSLCADPTPAPDPKNPCRNRIVCAGVIVNCECVVMKDWYVDQDKDGFESTSEKAENRPGGEYKEGISKGKDCDDTIWNDDNINCNLKKPWYLDNDNDGYHSQVKQAETTPGTKWKETTTGIDCNDARNSLTNDCSKADPCAEIKNILDYEAPDPNTKDLKPNINRLEDVVEAAVNDKEEGFEISKKMNADETYRYEFETVKPGLSTELGVNTSGSIIGTFHTHPSDGVAMFSFQDLRHLTNLYNRSKIQHKQDVFCGLVAKDEQGKTNVYILKVDDIAKLQKQVDDTWDNPDYAKHKTEKERRDAIHKDQEEEYAKESDKEKSFLKQFPAAGISVYKADATLSNFSKLTLNSGQVAKTPCN